MIPLADLKVALKLPAAVGPEDGFLGSCEAAAVAYVERETGRYFGGVASRTEYLDAFGHRELWLAEPPVAVTSVTVGSTVLAPADYSVRGRALFRSAGWGNRWGSEVTVEYTAGYAEGAEPADIRVLVTQLAGLMYEERIPVVTGTIASKIPMGAAEILQSWRVLR